MTCGGQAMRSWHLQTHSFLCRHFYYSC
jgi:hypothetical protein